MLLLTNLLKTQPKLLPKNLTFRPLSEAFIRRSWYSVVVLDKAEYEEKVLRMLSDGKTYEHLKKDPTASYKRKLVVILTRLKDEGKLSDELYSRLYPTSEKIPQLS